MGWLCLMAHSSDWKEHKCDRSFFSVAISHARLSELTRQCSVTGAVNGVVNWQADPNTMTYAPINGARGYVSKVPASKSMVDTSFIGSKRVCTRSILKEHILLNQGISRGNKERHPHTRTLTGTSTNAHWRKILLLQVFFFLITLEAQQNWAIICSRSQTSTTDPLKLITTHHQNVTHLCPQVKATSVRLKSPWTQLWRWFCENATFNSQFLEAHYLWMQ